MKEYSFSEARANLARVLDEAKFEPVIIRRRRGDAFTIVAKPAPNQSPFDIPGSRTQVSRKEILAALRESRARSETSQPKPVRRSRSTLRTEQVLDEDRGD